MKEMNKNHSNKKFLNKKRPRVTPKQKEVESKFDIIEGAYRKAKILYDTKVKYLNFIKYFRHLNMI